MNPYIDDDPATLAEHLRRFATGRAAPGFPDTGNPRWYSHATRNRVGQYKLNGEA
jgi:cyclohexanecarboxyl-CoA dehydrogenase